MGLVEARRVCPSRHGGKYLSMVQRAQVGATALNRRWATHAIAQALIDEMRLMGDEQDARELENQLATSTPRGADERSQTPTEALREATGYGTGAGFDPDLP
jgi:hypothetical protein